MPEVRMLEDEEGVLLPFNLGFLLGRALEDLDWFEEQGNARADMGVWLESPNESCGVFRACLSGALAAKTLRIGLEEGVSLRICHVNRALDVHCPARPLDRGIFDKRWTIHRNVSRLYAVTHLSVGKVGMALGLEPHGAWEPHALDRSPAEHWRDPLAWREDMEQLYLELAEGMI